MLLSRSDGESFDPFGMQIRTDIAMDVAEQLADVEPLVRSLFGIRIQLRDRQQLLDQAPGTVDRINQVLEGVVPDLRIGRRNRDLRLSL